MRPVAEQVRPGLLLAKRSGVLPYEDIQRNLGIRQYGWAIRPFSSDTRGEPVAAISYDFDGLPASQTPILQSILARTTHQQRASA